MNDRSLNIYDLKDSPNKSATYLKQTASTKTINPNSNKNRNLHSGSNSVKVADLC